MFSTHNIFYKILLLNAPVAVYAKNILFFVYLVIKRIIISVFYALDFHPAI